MLTKPRRVTSATYLEFIKRRPCLVCGHPEVDAHHVRFEGEGGMGTKPPDTNCVPLCRIEHNQYHAIGREKFERSVNADLLEACRVALDSLRAWNEVSVPYEMRDAVKRSYEHSPEIKQLKAAIAKAEEML